MHAVFPHESAELRALLHLLLSAPVSADLGISLYGGSALLEIHAAENRVLPKAPFQRKDGLLRSSLLPEPFLPLSFLLLQLFIVREKVKLPVALTLSSRLLLRHRLFSAEIDPPHKEAGIRDAVVELHHGLRDQPC